MSYSLSLHAVDLAAVREPVAARPDLIAALSGKAPGVDDARLADAWYAVRELALVREGDVDLPAWQGVRVAGSPPGAGDLDVLKHLLSPRPPFGWKAARRFPIVGHLTHAEIAAQADVLEDISARLADAPTEDEGEGLAVLELADAVADAGRAGLDLLSFFH